MSELIEASHVLKRTYRRLNSAYIFYIVTIYNYLQIKEKIMRCPISKQEISWVFFVFLILAVVIWINGSNHNLFLQINSQHSLLPDAVWEVFNFISYSKYFILPILLLVITFFKRRDKLVNIVLLIIAYYVVFALLKKLVGEARPFIVLAPDSFFWLNHYEDAAKSAYKSFPSGHTGNMAVFAFALSSMFFANKRILQFLVLLLVIITGLARICTGWHWPLDVLASGLIGYVLVKICLAFPFAKNSLRATDK